MPRAKKKARELTTDQALKRLFPKSMVRQLKELAAQKPVKTKAKQQSWKKHSKMAALCKVYNRENKSARRVGQVSASIPTFEGAPSKLRLGGDVPRDGAFREDCASAIIAEGEEV
jgi:hypothetical protein